MQAGVQQSHTYEPDASAFFSNRFLRTRQIAPFPFPTSSSRSVDKLKAMSAAASTVVPAEVAATKGADDSIAERRQRFRSQQLQRIRHESVDAAVTASADPFSVDAALLPSSSSPSSRGKSVSFSHELEHVRHITPRDRSASASASLASDELTSHARVRRKKKHASKKGDAAGAKERAAAAATAALLAAQAEEAAREAAAVAAADAELALTRPRRKPPTLSLVADGAIPPAVSAEDLAEGVVELIPSAASVAEEASNASAPPARDPQIRTALFARVAARRSSGSGSPSLCGTVTPSSTAGSSNWSENDASSLPLSPAGKASPLGSPSFVSPTSRSPVAGTPFSLPRSASAASSSSLSRRSIIHAHLKQSVGDGGRVLTRQPSSRSLPCSPAVRDTPQAGSLILQHLAQDRPRTPQTPPQQVQQPQRNVVPTTGSMRAVSMPSSPVVLSLPEPPLSLLERALLATAEGQRSIALAEDVTALRGMPRAVTSQTVTSTRGATLRSVTRASAASRLSASLPLGASFDESLPPSPLSSASIHPLLASSSSSPLSPLHSPSASYAAVRTPLPMSTLTLSGGSFTGGAAPSGFASSPALSGPGGRGISSLTLASGQGGWSPVVSVGASSSSSPLSAGFLRGAAVTRRSSGGNGTQPTLTSGSGGRSTLIWAAPTSAAASMKRPGSGSSSSSTLLRAS